VEDKISGLEGEIDVIEKIDEYMEKRMKNMKEIEKNFATPLK
jgi:hypothetical protein